MGSNLVGREAEDKLVNVKIKKYLEKKIRTKNLDGRNIKKTFLLDTKQTKRQ